MTEFGDRIPLRLVPLAGGMALGCTERGRDTGTEQDETLLLTGTSVPDPRADIDGATQ